MKISPANALEFFGHMDQAKLYLMYTGERGQPFIDRLAAIRTTFTPSDFDFRVPAAIDAMVMDLSGLHENTALAKQPMMAGASRAVTQLREAAACIRNNAE
jgi:hypothetical protein